MNSTRTEVWRDIEEFPGYAVSNFGRVLNVKSDIIKIQSLNQQGIPSVLFIKEQKQARRSVAVLVSTSFMVPHHLPHFGTVINLDGDRRNNHVDNLMWRPRWFAVKYHKQFKNPDRSKLRSPIRDMATGEEFESSWQAATKYGLLNFEIYLSIINRTYVFPTNQQFQEIIDL